MRLTRRLAKETREFNDTLEHVNTEYTSIADGMEGSLEFIVKFQLTHADSNDGEVRKVIETWSSARKSGESAKKSVLELTKQFEGFPRIEGSLNREIDRCVGLLQRFAGNIDASVSAINRALAVWDQSED